MPWTPDIEQRSHPFGEEGIRSSLEEVCKRAAAGASEILSKPEHLARVRTWAIDRLHRAKQNGERVSRPGDRARVLLSAVQKEKLWVPDPIGIEYIPAAHLMACDGDTHSDGTPCVKGDDCDGVLVFLAATFMAVGLYTMVVGHSYTSDRNIGHVLCKVYFDGKWHYADPSPLGDGSHMPLGKCVPPTREIYYSLPEIRVVCDGSTCDTRRLDPDELGFVQRGTFVGVNGIPVEELPPEAAVRWLEGPPAVRWLGDTTTDAWDAVYEKGKERNFGTSKQDIDDYATVGGSIAGGAACAATPGAEPLTPLCAYVGGIVANAVADAIQSIGGALFGGSGGPGWIGTWNEAADASIRSIVKSVRSQKGLDIDNPPKGSFRNYPEWYPIAVTWSKHVNSIAKEKSAAGGYYGKGDSGWFSESGKPGQVPEAGRLSEVTKIQIQTCQPFNYSYSVCAESSAVLPQAIVRATQLTAQGVATASIPSTPSSSNLKKVFIFGAAAAAAWFLWGYV